MIAFLDGELLEKNVGRVVLNVGGVGYELAVPTSVLAGLPGVGERARLHTRMVVREDSMTLYGFASTDERELFDLLTGVTGVGPKVGLAFLSALQPEALRRAVVADVDRLGGICFSRRWASCVRPPGRCRREAPISAWLRS